MTLAGRWFQFIVLWPPQGNDIMVTFLFKTYSCPAAAIWKGVTEMSVLRTSELTLGFVRASSKVAQTLVGETQLPPCCREWGWGCVGGVEQGGWGGRRCDGEPGL